MTGVAWDVRDGVAHLTLDGAARRNAIGGATLERLEAAIQSVAADPSVRAVVLTGDGPVFSAGADLREFEAIRDDAAAVAAFNRHGVAAFSALASLAVPVVCGVQGGAYGGGFELALHATIRVMAADAILTFPEVRSGWLPGWGGAQKLTALAGPSRAYYLLASSERLDASRALSWGIVHEIAEDAPERARALATALAQVQPGLLQSLTRHIPTTEPST